MIPRKDATQMNATDVLQTEPAAMQSGDAAGDNAPCARAAAT